MTFECPCCGYGVYCDCPDIIDIKLEAQMDLIHEIHRIKNNLYPRFDLSVCYEQAVKEIQDRLENEKEPIDI